MALSFATHLRLSIIHEQRRGCGLGGRAELVFHFELGAEDGQRAKVAEGLYSAEFIGVGLALAYADDSAWNPGSVSTLLLFILTSPVSSSNSAFLKYVRRIPPERTPEISFA